MTKILLFLSLFSFLQLQSHSLEHNGAEHNSECTQCLLSINNDVCDSPDNTVELPIEPKYLNEDVLFHFNVFYTSKTILVYEGRAPPFIS